MAKSLEELESEFNGGAAPAAAAPAGPGSLDELERQFSSGPAGIPKDKSTVAAPKAEVDVNTLFEPGFWGGVDKTLARLGSGISDVGMGVKQLMGGATPEDYAEKQRLDAPLTKGAAGTATNFMGKVLPFAAVPAMGGSLPAVLGYNALVGGAQGMTEPVAPGGSRVMNTVTGMVGGAAAPAVVQGITNLVKPAVGATTDLARRALGQAIPIPLGPRDVSSSGFTKAIGSLLNDLPITGPMGAKHAEEVNSAITHNVARAAGIDSPMLDQAAVQAQKKVLSKGFDKLWNNAQVEVDANLFGALQMAHTRLDELAPETASTVRKAINTLTDPARIIQDPSGKLYLPGSLVNDIQQRLGTVAGTGKGVEREIAGGLQREVLDAFGRSTPQGSQQELSRLKGQWKALTKVIEPLVNSAEAGVAGREAGQIPLALLPNQAKTAYGSKLNTSPFADLAPIAGRFGVDRTPRTGGSMRAMIQNGLGGIAGGAGAYAVGSGTPVLNVLGTAIGGGTLLGTIGAAAQKALTSPTITRRVMQEPVKRALLGAPALAPALRELGSSGISRGTAGGGLAIMDRLANARPSESSPFEEEVPAPTGGQ